MKKKILFCTEATWLSTGYAKYYKEIIERIHATDKFEIAEFGSYGSNRDPRANQLPWKFYGNLPENPNEEELYKSNKLNEFGFYKIDAVISDFQPDIVMDARDPWMFDFIQKSQFRDNFKLVLTPTVDSAPQKQVWIDEVFKRADVVTTYSRFGKRTLEDEGVKVTDVTSPGVNLDLFIPKNKQDVRADWGLGKNLKIIGTVMRNQKRKCFSDLFEAYATLRRKYGKIREVEKSVLLCHTSWPDHGWDLPELLRRTQIQRHTIFTYKCDACTKTFFSWFLPCEGGTGKGLCIFCGEMAAHMPNTHIGVTEEELSDIYNLMDVYIQPAICEGWGLPIVEAKSCGVPGLYSNYSGMEDHIENGGGIPIEIDRFYVEPETMAIRSLPSQDSMVEGLKFFLTEGKKRLKMGKVARETCEKLHNWDITANKFIEIFDTMEVHDRAATWDKKPLIKILPQHRPDNLGDVDFIRWCYISYLNREPEEKGMNDWLKSIASGTPRGDVEGFFRNKMVAQNTFEKIRWQKSLISRGFSLEDNVKVYSDRLPGGLVR